MNIKLNLFTEAEKGKNFVCFSHKSQVKWRTKEEIRKMLLEIFFYNDSMILPWILQLKCHWNSLLHAFT